MEKEEKQYVLESSTKALITFIPFIGGAIGSVIGQISYKKGCLSTVVERLKKGRTNN